MQLKMKNLVSMIIVVCLAVVFAGCEKSSPVTGNTADGTPQRIGVYDSRCVAVAFAGNPEHEARTAEELAALEAAKAEGDPETIAAADDRVWESRKRLHRQGFGTAAVDDIFAFYPDQLESLEQAHDLTALVSQWDKKTIKSYRDAQRVDITEDLIDMLGPNDRQRRSALSIRKHKPLTPAQVEKMIQQEMQED